MGGRFHPKLNIRLRPIANKYCEGKVKRALKRGLKVPETARREANGTSPPRGVWAVHTGVLFKSAQAAWVAAKGLCGLVRSERASIRC